MQADWVLQCLLAVPKPQWTNIAWAFWRFDGFSGFTPFVGITLPKQGKIILIEFPRPFIEGCMMNKLIPVALLSVVFLSACTTYSYQPAPDMQAFYADKLKCETQFAGGFNIWGNKVYGNIYRESPARDCMLARGYKSL